MWNVAVRLTSVDGKGCVAERMQSQIGEARPFTVSLVQKGSGLQVTLRSASGDYACTFNANADSDGFTTYGVPGYFICEQEVDDVRCADGSLHHLFSWGQDIAGRISGAEISGTWDGVWDDLQTGMGVGAKAQFTGSRDVAR